MKKLDLIFTIVAIVTVVLSLGYVIINYPIEMIKLIGVIMNIAFMIFIAMHLALCFPLFFLIMVPKEFIQDTKWHMVIHKTSSVLGWLVILIVQGISIFSAYFIYPAVAAMFFCATWDIQLAWDSNIYVLLDGPRGPMQ